MYQRAPLWMCHRSRSIVWAYWPSSWMLIWESAPFVSTFWALLFQVPAMIYYLLWSSITHTFHGESDIRHVDGPKQNQIHHYCQISTAHAYNWTEYVMLLLHLNVPSNKGYFYSNIPILIFFWYFAALCYT